MDIVKDLLSVMKTMVESKVHHGKQELEGRLLFWALKGTLSVLAVIFISISLFTWLTNVLSMAHLAALMTAIICILVYILIGFIQTQFNKRMHNKHDEWLLVVMPLVEAFIEGVNTEKKTKKEKDIEKDI